MTVHPLSRLEMMLVKTLKNMGGQILGYNSRFYNPIHLQPVRRKVMMMYLELFAELGDHCVIEICTVVSNNPLWYTISTYKIMSDKLRHNVLGYCSKREGINPLREVINGH